MIFVLFATLTFYFFYSPFPRKNLKPEPDVFFTLFLLSSCCFAQFKLALDQPIDIYYKWLDKAEEVNSMNNGASMADHDHDEGNNRDDDEARDLEEDAARNISESEDEVDEDQEDNE